MCCFSNLQRQLAKELRELAQAPSIPLSIVVVFSFMQSIAELNAEAQLEVEVETISAWH